MLKVFENVIEQVKAEIGVAGGAFLAIKDGETIIKECWGTADIETGRPITENTVFDIASDSKCFTTMLLAMFCDEGLLDWDKPVRTWWPDFFLSDEYVSSHITLRDMVSHRSGLASNNLIRCSGLDLIPTRADYIERVQHLTLTSDFRYRFHYQNELFAVAGYLMEKLTGKTYEELIVERIAKPLGMEVAFRGMPTDLPDIAMPHFSSKGGIEKGVHNSFSHNNPCGGVRTNIRSWEKWLRFLLAGGCLPDGTRLVSEKQFKNLYHPNSYWSDGNDLDRARSYGLGLAPSVYRGEHLVYHGGSITGFRSAMGFFPGKNSGYLVMINSTAQPLAVLKTLLCDAALGCLEDDYSERTAKGIESFLKPRKEFPKGKLTPEQQKLYSGRYWNDAYHDIYVTPNDEGGLHIQYVNVGGDVFEAEQGLLKGYVWGIETMCRFAEDGKSAQMSFCEAWTPTPFKKISD